jgi:hypothetical protein
VQQAGFEYEQLPIVDMSTPADVTEACTFVSTVADLIRRKHNVAMHCRYDFFCTVIDLCVSSTVFSLTRRLWTKCRLGEGRAGMMAACVLVSLGHPDCSAANAISMVRSCASERCIRTTRQAEFVQLYEATLHQDADHTCCETSACQAGSNSACEESALDVARTMYQE